ncbi:MAG TPA: MOSC domain-containing protein [Gemmatimonadales bacterium]|nr:MOSC domain-containing protein [Gemmatimonadales bacterium]
MKILSIHVGRPREIPWEGKTVLTSIFKHPVPGPVAVRATNLDGDEQSDLSVHGGKAKAVYVYPSEHYAWWRRELPGVDFTWGVFGENLTVTGLLETAVHVGDRLRAGSAEFVVTQPRMPCYKLGIRFNDPGMVQRFQDSGRNGFYLAVEQEGSVRVGDSIEIMARDPHGMSVALVAELYTSQHADPELLQRVSELPALPERWRERFRARVPRVS